MCVGRSGGDKISKCTSFAIQVVTPSYFHNLFQNPLTLNPHCKLKKEESSEVFREKLEVVNKASSYELFIGDISGTGKKQHFFLSPGIMGVTVTRRQSLRCTKVWSCKMGPQTESRGKKEREAGTAHSRGQTRTQRGRCRYQPHRCRQRDRQTQAQGCSEAPELGVTFHSPQSFLEHLPGVCNILDLSVLLLLLIFSLNQII